MRNLVIGICSFTFFLMLLLTGYTVTAKKVRNSQLEAALNLALEQAVFHLQYQDEYSPQSDEEFVAMFEQQFIAQLTAEADYEILVLDADYRRGLLSVEIREHYRHMNGRQGEISVQKLIILDRIAEGALYGTKTLTFWVGGEQYRKYELAAGSAAVAPPQPYLAAGTFAGWRLSPGGALYDDKALAELVMEEDMDFVAEIQE